MDLKEIIDQISVCLKGAQSLQSWQWAAIFTLIFGYLCRKMPERWLPNEAIPWMCIVVGALTTMYFAPPAPDDAYLVKVWRGVNMGIGIIVGFLVWLLHRFILKKIEDKFPWLKDVFDSSEKRAIRKADTAFITKSAAGVANGPPPSTPAPPTKAP